MYYWPKEDPKYDHSKSRAENYRNLRKLFERDSSIKTIEQWAVECRSMLENERYYKGAHLDWNYTEMLRDLIDQGVVKVPITDFDVLFVEWACGNLDSLSPHTKRDQALYNWNDDEKDPAIRFKLRMDNGKCFPWDEIHKATELCCYTDSNREEFTPSPVALRKERFDEIFYANLPNKSECEKIFDIHISKHRKQDLKFIDIKK